VEGSDNPENALEDRDKLLPALEEGQILEAEKVEPKQHFTKPPARYTEASLVRKMEEVGIGRPSTYAPTISTIISRGYVNMENKVLFPTDTAEVVDGLLVQHFPNVVDMNFTASMENDLDSIAEGKRKYIPFLHDFYGPFNTLIEEKDKSIKKEDVVNTPTDEKCEECGENMVIKLGRMGKFLSCSAYPKCKNAKPLGEESEERKALKEKYKDQKCPECESPMDVKASRYGDFLACTAYPKCKKTLPIVKSTGVTCPVCSSHELVEKKGKMRNSVFYGCNGYPECDYLIRYKPLRNAEEGDGRGFYIEKKGEETFFEFDPEAWEKQRERYAKSKEKKAAAAAAAASKD
jgi:DNA topoisomerase-1